MELEPGRGMELVLGGMELEPGRGMELVLGGMELEPGRGMELGREHGMGLAWGDVGLGDMELGA